MMIDLLNEIKDYQTITLFRHQSADADALGSQFGMKLFLEANCPNVKVYALGDDVGSSAELFPPIDHVDDELIKQSCAIILDTANAERIDDARALSAKKIIKIDHHIVVDEYADVAYVDTTAAATCEILSDLFKETGKVVNEECAKYLYLGLLADSISFTTSSTTANTLKSAAFLVSCGLNVNKINQERSGFSLNDFIYVTKVRNRYQLDGNVAYSIMQVEDYAPLGFDYNLAKEKVFALANVKEFEIYCLFTEDASYESKGLYNGSLRSKNVAIDKVANKYNGGGHAQACGVKKLTLEDIQNLVNDLKSLL